MNTQKSQVANFTMLVGVVFVLSMIHFSTAAKCTIPKSDQFIFLSGLGCDSDKLHLSCKRFKGAGIRIYKARYGRPRGASSQICFDESRNLTTCPDVDVKDILSEMCDRKRHCGFKVLPETFKLTNTCPTVFKYLDVMFLCWKGYRQKKPGDKKNQSSELVTQGDGTEVKTILLPGNDEDATFDPTTDPCVTSTPAQATIPADTPTPTTPLKPWKPSKKTTPPKTQVVHTPFVFYQQRKSSFTLMRQSAQFVTLILLMTFCALVYI